MVILISDGCHYCSAARPFPGHCPEVVEGNRRSEAMLMPRVSDCNMYITAFTFSIVEPWRSTARNRVRKGQN